MSLLEIVITFIHFLVGLLSTDKVRGITPKARTNVYRPVKDILVVLSIGDNVIQRADNKILLRMVGNIDIGVSNSRL